MKKRIAVVALIAMVALTSVGCAQLSRDVKEWQSNVTGLRRTVRVYSHSGELIEEYQSDNMIVKDGEGGTIQIDFDGKRVIFSNAVVVIEEDMK